MRSAAAVCCALVIVLSGFSGLCAAEEKQHIRVSNFHASIRIQPDGDILVQETMRVVTGGATLVRQRGPMLTGIYRAVGGRLQGQHAYYRLTGFEMKGATLDGNEIPYAVETHGNWYTRYIFLGPEQLTLSPGSHEFTIEYRVDRHVKFLEDHDELFWWVFGEGMHGWAESVGTVGVTVVFPYGTAGILASLEDHSWNAGTNRIAGLLHAAEASGAENVRHYGRVLSPKQSYLSVVASMPKGAVREPDFDKQALFFFRDMSAYLAGLIGLTVFFAYYLAVWARVGRDPEAGPVMPRYKPPAGCSPAVARRLVTMGYDRRTFAAALMNLAARGVIRIGRRGNGYYVEQTGRKPDDLFPDEQVLHAALTRAGREDFPGGPQEKLDAVTIHRAYRKHRRHLVSAVNRKFFVKNLWYVIPGILLSIAVALINAEIVDVEGGYVRILAGLGAWTLLAGFLARFLALKKALELGRPSRVVYLLILFPLVLYAIAVIISNSTEVFNIMKFMFLAPLFVMMTAHVIFFFLLRAPTHVGRLAMDAVAGFRVFLAAAEGDRLDRMTPPEKTPELFQAYLPYALALDVENRWAENFSGEIDETYTLPPLDVFLGAVARLFPEQR